MLFSSFASNPFQDTFSDTAGRNQYSNVKERNPSQSSSSSAMTEELGFEPFIPTAPPTTPLVAKLIPVPLDAVKCGPTPLDSLSGRTLSPRCQTAT